MNNKKSRPKKRKLSGLEEGSGPDSSDDDGELLSNSDEESDGGSASDDSVSSASSESSTGSHINSVRRPKASRLTDLLSDSSESGDENSEKCAICLRSIVSQEVGNPEVCDHLFCSVCIIEWSKKSNVCPLDRQQFSIILVRENKDGNLVKKVPVEEPQVSGIESVEFEALNDTVCEVCGSGDREDILLLCDNCDRGFHTICLTPPLENIPDENEWFCPDCELREPTGAEALVATGLDDFLDNVSTRFRTLRPRVQMVRTRLLERIRVTVNRIVENYVLRHSEDPSDSELSDESNDSTYSLESDFDFALNEPSTSGVQPSRPNDKKVETKTEKETKTRKKTKKVRKRKTGTRKKRATTKRKTSGTVKKKTAKRKLKVRTTKTKKVKLENADGTVTEKVVKTRTYKRRRQKRRRKKIRRVGVGRRGLRVKSINTPKTVKGRLALMLGMVPPKNPGQLLPDVKIRSSNTISIIDLNHSRAGIPKLHIFGPRDELQYYSSGSDNDDIVVGGSGGVATVTQARSSISRLRDRKKAALIFQSNPSSSAPKPKPVIEPPSGECVDILGSILDSQAIWHSKDTNSNVKINSDGSIEVIKNKESGTSKPENSKPIDVREGTSDGVTTQAPMQPGSGNKPGGLRPYNRNNYGESRSNQDNMFSPRSGQSSTGVNFNRFGGPARNDREGYTNYLNNMPQGPTPFCRGGPPLRFRMPPRQQLRRIPFPPRNRPAWQTEEEGDENGNDKNDGAKEATDAGEKTSTQKTQEEEEDIDLYSDIETNVDKNENSGAEETGSNYPALGPPPEPSPFLLGLDENGEFGVTEQKDKSEVYDPAEPCDSEDEMVIDENQERASTPEKKEPEQDNKTESVLNNSAVPPSSRANEDGNSSHKGSSGDDEEDDDDDDDCPIFSIYSSASREFSQKEEDERQREIAEDRKKLEEMKSQGKQNKTAVSSDLDKIQNVQDTGDTKTHSQVEETAEGEAEEISAERLTCVKKTDDTEVQLYSDTELVIESKNNPSPVTKTVRDSRSRSNSTGSHSKHEIKNHSPEYDKTLLEKSPSNRDKSSSPEAAREDYKRSKRNDKKSDSDSDEESNKVAHDKISYEENEIIDLEDTNKENLEQDVESESENVSQKIATGLEGLDVEEVSSDNGEAFADKRSISSLSLSDMSQRSKSSRSPVQVKKKKKNKKRKIGRSQSGKNYEDGEIDDSEKDNRLDDSCASKKDNDEIGNENSPKSGEKRRTRKSTSTGSERQILGSRENKKSGKEKGKDKDLSWKKPSKKEKNYREGKKRSNDRGRSKSNDKRKSKSPSPKKDKKKNKERKKKTDKKKDIERYDVRKVVKNKEMRKTDAFGRDLISKSRSISRSHSRSPVRDRSRNMLRRESRSFSRSRSRSYRRGRSPVRRRYLRSRTRSRSKSIRRSYSRSRSRSRSRKSKKKFKTKERLKMRSRSRGRKSRSLSRSRRRSLTRSRSRSPAPRLMRSKKTTGRSRKSWSHHASRSPSYSSRRSRSITRSPIRVRRSSYSRSASSSWSRGRSPLPRTSSLEKLTVVLTTKEKKKWKKKEGKKGRKDEKRRKKTGNSKEVFASGDNVLVSVNFRNNNNTVANNSVSIMNTDTRNTRLNSVSPGPGAETSRKKKRSSDYETERVSKKSKKSNPISKKVVDVALSNASSKRAKKLTRLSEKDAEVILNRKPVAVIDLDMSPYREQTPSPVNVVVVSDSGSGDEGKEHTPQRQATRGTPMVEGEKVQEAVGNQSVTVSAPSSPAENEYVVTSGPKTPPEPQIKFSINKPQQLRQIANPLGDDDDDDEVEEDTTEQRVESLDRRIEKELDNRNEVVHKGPNTPPAPRGPSTPKTPPSPQTSPDAYDPFEPTKSRSPSPSQADKENRPSPKLDEQRKEDQSCMNVQGEGVPAMAAANTDNVDRVNDAITENHDDKLEGVDKCDAGPAADSSANVVIPNQASGASATDMAAYESPEKKITVVITSQQNKTQGATVQKTYAPVLKQLPMVSAASVTAPTSGTLTVTTDVFPIPSPTKTSRTTTATTQSMQVTGIQRLQHRLGSPVNRTPNMVKSTAEKRSQTRTTADATTQLFTSGNYMIRNANKRNGDSAKQPRPLQDATNETIDMTLEMEESPYSPASSEGDDLFDPPMEPSKPSQSNSKPAPTYKGASKVPRKSPAKQLNKFDLLFGPSLSPVKVGNKKVNAKIAPKPTPTAAKVLPPKPQKKGPTKKNLIHKMDEDQLRILDELPSSAVELQVKDKFLKKLNRQERVVDEVKTVLKPHYARKHITKEEYKDILRRSVPKICHSRSGEINPSKIQSLIEAYVKKFRHAKKKGMNAAAAVKPKVKKTMFS